MSEFLNWFGTNWELYSAILIGIIFCIVLVFMGRWAVLRGIIYKMMLAAEMLFQSGEGTARFEAVLNALYIKYPILILLISEDKLRATIQEYFDKAQDWADDGMINGSQCK